jgi:hypothetical protein
VDLYDPSSGDQVHDFNADIADNGVFWTIQIPDSALTVSKNLKAATLHVENVQIIDSFTFLGEHSVPATVSFDITWVGSGARHHYKPGSEDPTDPTNFNGKFRDAVATGSFSGSNADGFSFTSDPGATSAGVFAEIGIEKNGSFIS